MSPPGGVGGVKAPGPTSGLATWEARVEEARAQTRVDV